MRIQAAPARCAGSHHAVCAAGLTDRRPFCFAVNRRDYVADNTGMVSFAEVIAAPERPPATRPEALPRVAPLDIAPLTGRHLAAWDTYVRAHAEGTIFHTIAWMHSVRDAFRHEPQYLVALRGAKLVGVLPLFRVNSLLGGRMFISVPYAVAGGPLADNQQVADSLFSAAKRLVHEAEGDVLEIRSERRCFDQLEPIDRYVTFKRELPEQVGDVLGWLPRKARAAARNARERHSLRAEFHTGQLRTVWRLYCRSMRRLGSPAYPYRFFEELCERNRGRTHVQTIRRGNRAIAGLVSFTFGETFLPYFAGCDERFNRYGTNNFLYLAAMERAVEGGCRIFDFGRTRIDNKGSYDFKRFHGFNPEPLGYQRYVPPDRTSTDLTPTNRSFSAARALWRRLPLPLATMLAGRVSRHIPG